MPAVHTMISTAAHPAPAVDRTAQRLAGHGLQGGRELGADLLLLLGGEHVDDAGDGVLRGLRVQGGEHQVARSRRR